MTSRAPILALAIFTLTRLGLLLWTGSDNVPLSFWPGIFLKGLWFDLTVVAAVGSPALLYEAVLPNRLRTRAWHRGARLALFWAAAALLLLCAAAESVFWLEFSTRFNFIAVDYLLYTHEVLGNIRESYPVGWLLAGIAALAAVITRLVRRTLAEPPLTWRRRAAFAGAALLLPSLSLLAADIDQMRGSGNAYADELAGNGLFTLFSAMRRNELDYDRFYRTIPQEAADKRLEALGVERVPLSRLLAREPAPDPADDPLPFKRRPRNVVLISVESLSASFVGAYGDSRGLTPRLDRLAKEGLKFDRVFATGTRTVRGLEALSLGTPPVPGQAIVRRSNNEHLATLGEILRAQGMSPLFFYGGFGYFDNMNVYFAGNGYQVVDRRDFPRESVVFANIWGVADEVLFNNALKALDAQSKPFFAHIMTTSNHRPYTYPDGRIDIKSPGGREGAVKYSDWAVGRFIDDAKSRPWFKDTLFVIVADHCASVAGRTTLPVANYRIPLIFYAPALVKPGLYRPLVSQIDLAPTIIELLGKQGDDHFFGRAFFERGAPLERAFISNYQELGYLRRGFLTVLGPKNRVQSFRVDPNSYASVPAPVDPDLLEEAVSYYQTASRAFKAGALRLP